MVRKACLDLGSYYTVGHEFCTEVFSVTFCIFPVVFFVIYCIRFRDRNAKIIFEFYGSTLDLLEQNVESSS